MNPMSAHEPEDRINPSHPPPFSPELTDENEDISEVVAGMEAAENEIRDLVAQGYEEQALDSDQVEDELADIDYTLGDSASDAPEVNAIHEQFIQEIADEDEDESLT
jgi:hypothetical protein